ncbi:MAG TPA: NAD-dependent epimerase/dehydratase family protein [Crocinitomix sp.]|nr:NAD-dependent epimerase/dehydratase family protein [Crocinitomix sp.]
MIFVTGGTGLLGSHLLIELTKRGKNIRALKRKSSDLSEIKLLFKYYLKDVDLTLFNKIEWVNGDINDISILPEKMKGCDTVYHCAGFVSFLKKDFKSLIKINKEGTANIVNTCLKLNIKTLSYVSSTAAIGRAEKQPIYTEKSKWVTSKSNSNYAVSKYLGEMEAWRGAKEGINVSIVNPSVILGAGNWNQSSLTLFKSIKQGLKFYTTGTNAFVDARDVAFCMVSLVENGIFSERFLTVSENLKFKTLFELIAQELNVKKPNIEVKPWMVGLAWRIEGIKCFFTRQKPQVTEETSAAAMQISKYANQKIKKQLGFEFISIKDSIKNAVAYQAFKKLNKN